MMETRHDLKESTLEGLQDLIKVNLDSGEGFKAAADKIEDETIAAYFCECARRRETFAHDLQSAVRTAGHDPEDSGSVKGTVHRWWLNIRGAVAQGDEHSVLAEAERGEDAIKERYEEVLKDTAGSPLNDVLQQQYASVKSDHDRIRDMRDARA